MSKNTYFRTAVKDIELGFKSWQLSYVLSVGDIRQRYSRSKLGQFWISISMLIFIVAIGVVYSFLFHQSIRTFLPYVACNYVVWMWISSSISDSTHVFVQAKQYLEQTRIPRSVFVLRVIIRNLINFLHNILIVPLVFLCMMRPLSWTIILAIPGIVLILGCSFFACLSIGVICTRFRDLPQVVQSLMQITMFLTPIMWPETSLNKNVQIIVSYNPFAALLHMVSKPLQGVVPSVRDCTIASLAFIVIAGIALYIFSRFRARIVYWL